MTSTAATEIATIEEGATGQNRATPWGEAGSLTRGERLTMADGSVWFHPYDGGAPICETPAAPRFTVEDNGAGGFAVIDAQGQGRRGRVVTETSFQRDADRAAGRLNGERDTDGTDWPRYYGLETAPPWERPCAAAGLTSYRLKGRYGWVMIGARDHAEAMREAARSTAAPTRDALEVWNGSAYVPAFATDGGGAELESGEKAGD